MNAAKLEKLLQAIDDKVIYLEQEKALESDASAKYKVGEEIKELKIKREEVQGQLAEAYSMRSTSGLGLLGEEIKKLSLNPEKAGLQNRLNCDRREKVSQFWDCFDRFPGDGFNFYFVSSCPTQMPQCFSERAVVEVMVQELEERMLGIHQRLQPNNDRLQLFDLPVGRNLKRSQRAFRKFLGKYFGSQGEEKLEDLFRKALVNKGYEYAALVFTMHETQWTSDYPAYFRWIIEQLSGLDLPGIRVLLFFSVKVDALHRGKNLTDTQRLIAQTFNQLEADYKRVGHLSPLKPVLESDLKAWLDRMGEGNPGKVERLLTAFVRSLTTEDQKLYKEYQLFNMDDIDLLQEAVFEVMNE